MTTYDIRGVTYGLSADRPSVAHSGLLYVSTDTGEGFLGRESSWLPIGVGSGGNVGVSVLEYGADPDGVGDSLEAFQQAQAAAGSGGLVYVPPGTYLISEELVLTTSFIGEGNTKSIIKAAAGFTGDRMFNVTGGVPRLFFRDLKVDGSDIVGISAIRHDSLLTNDKANRLHVCNVYFEAFDADSYVIFSEETNNSPGGMVGNLFERCDFRGCGKNIYLGNNEDDITFLSCRIHADKPPTDGFMCWTAGVNTRFEGCYIYFSEITYTYAGIKVPWFLGPYQTSFHSCFLEYGHEGLNYLFIQGTPIGTTSFKNCHYNLSLVDTTTPNFVAVCRVNISGATTGNRKEFDFDGVVKYDSKTYTLVDVYVNGDTSDYGSWVDVTATNCHGWARDQIASKQGKAGEDYIYVRVNGHTRGYSMVSFPVAQNTLWIEGGNPGVWLVPSDGTSDGAYMVLVGDDLTIQRRAATIGGTYEGAPYVFDIQAPNNSLVIDNTGYAAFLGAIEFTHAYTEALYMEAGAPIIQMSEDIAQDGVSIAFNAGTLLVQRRASGYGASEADIVNIDIQAPAHSLDIDTNGYITTIGVVLDSGSLYFQDGTGTSDQLYNDLASDSFTWNRASAAGAYEATLASLNVQTGRFRANSLVSVGSITLEQVYGSNDYAYWSLASDQLTLNRSNSSGTYEATLLTIDLQNGSLKLPTATVAGLPAAGTARRLFYASNGRKNGEGAGAGTGVLVFDDGVAWRACDTGATVAA